MVLAGLACCAWPAARTAAASFPCRRRCWAFVLMNIGMLALLLDLTHRLYVWGSSRPSRSPRRWPGLVGADHRLRRAAGVGADPPARRLALARPHGARPQDLVRHARGTAALDRRAGLAKSRAGTAWASTPASCSTRWWRGPCGTAPSSAPCSCSPGCRRGGGDAPASVALHGRPAPQAWSAARSRPCCSRWARCRPRRRRSTP